MGFAIEELWCLIKNKCFQIRQSLVYSPLIPIYGIATLFIVIVADRIGYNLWKVFLIGIIVATIVEYVCSYVQEKVFKTKSWDYSQMKFNINGRVNLLYSLGFGVFAVILIKQIKQLVILMEQHTNDNLFYIVSFLVLGFFVFDVIVSSLACLRWNERRKGIEAKNGVERFLDKKYPDSRLNKIYNNSVFVG